MNIAQVKKQFSDKLSICLSLCCILHCIALPVIILMIPSFASLWINNEKVHVILVLFAVMKNNKIFSYIALSWAFFYITFAMIQQHRAEVIGIEIAKSRGHSISSIIAKPSFANLIVWKTIYTTENSYHIDAVKLGYNSNIIEGTEVKKFEIQESFPWLNINSQQAKDIERFRWFSNGYIAISDVNPNYIMDIRYSTLPYKADGLWGIKLNYDANKYDHVETISNRRSRVETYEKLWELIIN